jgi:hypothetical protein
MVKKRDAVIQVYVTPEEKERIEKRAAAVGLSAAAHARALLLADAQSADKAAASTTTK